MTNIFITQISAVYNEKDKVEAIYGVDNNGIVYWYRDTDWLDIDTKQIIKTEGWVPLQTNLSEEFTSIKKDDEQQKSETT